MGLKQAAPQERAAEILSVEVSPTLSPSLSNKLLKHLNGGDSRLTAFGLKRATPQLRAASR